MTSSQRNRRTLGHETANLSMPALHLSVSAPLDPMLSAMGLGPAYSGADFSPMLGPGGGSNHALATVRQAATLDVDPWGTDAAAATGAVAVPMLALNRSVTIDHPYLFLIRDTVTGALLFTAVVENPTA
jgi:serpin B